MIFYFCDSCSALWYANPLIMKGSVVNDRKNLAIIGASSTIAQAYIEFLCSSAQPMFNIYAFSRHFDTSTQQRLSIYPQVHLQKLDYEDEEAIANHASQKGDHFWDRVLVFLGSLGTDPKENLQEDFSPEKSLSQIEYHKFQRSFWVNTILPCMLAKYFMPQLKKNVSSKFMFLSARVGSISDNRLGGWYAYRSAKAALNMFIKSSSIELARTHKDAVVVGYHPGTVRSGLSAPFLQVNHKHIAFDPLQAAEYLHDILETLHLECSGKVIDWDGKEILP